MLVRLWKPEMGMYVKEIEANFYLYQFYHEIDINIVIEGSPWTLNMAQLIFKRIKPGENPKEVTLNQLVMWEQVHEL